MCDTGPEQVKKCSGCREVKSLAEFSKDKSRKDGLTPDCKVCRAESNRKWCESNPEKHRGSNRKWYESNPEKIMHKTAKKRAKDQGVPFDIQPSDIEIPAACPVFGIELFRGKGSIGPNSPSLDKIIPGLGYVKGNIMVISHLANVMKSNATWEQCELLGKFASRQIASRNAIHIAA